MLRSACRYRKSRQVFPGVHPSAASAECPDAKAPVSRRPRLFDRRGPNVPHVSRSSGELQVRAVDRTCGAGRRRHRPNPPRGGRTRRQDGDRRGRIAARRGRARGALETIEVRVRHRRHGEVGHARVPGRPPRAARLAAGERRLQEQALRRMKGVRPSSAPGMPRALDRPTLLRDPCRNQLTFITRIPTSLPPTLSRTWTVVRRGLKPCGNGRLPRTVS